MEKKCSVSPMYGKDENKNLYFYCDFCGKEMDMDEIRDCLVEREVCKACKADIGDSDFSVSTCLICDSPIEKV